MIGADQMGGAVIPDVPDRPEGVAADGSKVDFIDRVKGFAKKDAGKVGLCRRRKKRECCH